METYFKSLVDVFDYLSNKKLRILLNIKLLSCVIKDEFEIINNRESEDFVIVSQNKGSFSLHYGNLNDAKH